MYFQLPEVPSGEYSFKFFNQDWTLKEGESWFFKEERRYSLKEFLQEAVPHIYRPAPRQIPEEESLFYCLSPANRTRVYLEYLRSKTDLSMDVYTRDEMDRFIMALQWLESCTPVPLAILTNWRLYNSVYQGMPQEAAYHMCIQGPLPEYRSPKLEKNSEVRIKVGATGLSLNFLPLTSESFLGMWEFSAKKALSKTSFYSEREIESVFAGSLYLQGSSRLNLTPELRAVSFAAFQEARNTFKMVGEGVFPDGILSVPENEKFLEPGDFFIPFSKWRELPYYMSEAAIEVRQRNADRINWEKFCSDILSVLEGPNDVLSTKELAELVPNRRALKKWREMGYLIEVPELRQGRTTYWRCPLL